MFKFLSGTTTTIVIGSLGLLLNSVLAVISFSDGQYLETFLFSFIAFIALVNTIAVATNTMSNLHRINLMLIITSFVAILYVDFPDLLIAVASVVGVASFIYLIIEKFIEDSV